MIFVEDKASGTCVGILSKNYQFVLDRIKENQELCRGHLNHGKSSAIICGVL